MYLLDSNKYIYVRKNNSSLVIDTWTNRLFSYCNLQCTLLTCSFTIEILICFILFMMNDIPVCEKLIHVLGYRTKPVFSMAITRISIYPLIKKWSVQLPADSILAICVFRNISVQSTVFLKQSMVKSRRHRFI